MYKSKLYALINKYDSVCKNLLLSTAPGGTLIITINGTNGEAIDARLGGGKRYYAFTVHKNRKAAVGFADDLVIISMIERQLKIWAAKQAKAVHYA